MLHAATPMQESIGTTAPQRQNRRLHTHRPISREPMTAFSLLVRGVPLRPARARLDIGTLGSGR